VIWEMRRRSQCCRCVLPEPRLTLANVASSAVIRDVRGDLHAVAVIQTVKGTSPLALRPSPHPVDDHAACSSPRSPDLSTTGSAATRLMGIRGMTLQADGFGSNEAISTPTDSVMATRSGSQVSGIGMGDVLAPVAKVVLAAVRRGGGQGLGRAERVRELGGCFAQQACRLSCGRTTGSYSTRPVVRRRGWCMRSGSARWSSSSRQWQRSIDPEAAKGLQRRRWRSQFAFAEGARPERYECGGQDTEETTASESQRGGSQLRDDRCVPRMRLAA